MANSLLKSALVAAGVGFVTAVASNFFNPSSPAVSPVTPYTDAAGRYAVVFPSPPTAPAPSNEAEQRQLGNLRFQVAGPGPHDPNTAYSVAYADVQSLNPIMAAAHSDSTVFLELPLWQTQLGMRDSAKLLQTHPILVHGYRGIEYLWHNTRFRNRELRGLLTRHQVFLVKDRLYMLTVSGQEPNSANAQAFFRSFRLPATPAGQHPPVRHKTPTEIIEKRYPDGAVFSTQEIVRGTLKQPQQTLRRVYYPSGRLQSEAYMQGAFQHGSARAWYATGTLRYQTQFCHDTLCGTGTDYYPSGRPEIVYTYRSGAMASARFYGPDGTAYPDPNVFFRGLTQSGASASTWSEEQRALAAETCLQLNSHLSAPTLFCDCYLKHVFQRVRPTDYLALGSYGNDGLARALNATECF